MDRQSAELGVAQSRCERAHPVELEFRRLPAFDIDEAHKVLEYRFRGRESARNHGASMPIRSGCGQAPPAPGRYWMRGSSALKHGYLVDSPAPPHNAVRRRTRSPLTPRRQAGADSRAAAQVHPSGNKKLIVVESEGAVFDGLRHRHEQGYLPAFIGRFAWGADPSLCARIWRSVALESRFRGEAPQVCLAAALRLLNTRYPSVRRVAVAKALETHLAARAPGAPGLDRAVSGAAADLVADWESMAEGLLREAGPPPVFEEASRFLAPDRRRMPGHRRACLEPISRGDRSQSLGNGGNGRPVPAHRRPRARRYGGISALRSGSRLRYGTSARHRFLQVHVDRFPIGIGAFLSDRARKGSRKLAPAVGVAFCDAAVWRFSRAPRRFSRFSRSRLRRPF